MYRIRFHGRGGQGMKAASRILGTALFREGFEVQDAPRYGAERRGAPIFAYVRADHQPILERGVIAHPDLVVVADDSLVPVPAAGVMTGVVSRTVVLVNSETPGAVWQQRLNFGGEIINLPVATADRSELRFIGAACAAAAARLIGAVTRSTLSRAIHDELANLGEQVLQTNLTRALHAYDAMAEHDGCVTPAGDRATADYRSPDWIDLPFEHARVSAPAIHATATSVQVRTGLWRTLRPVIDTARCNKCWWICSTFCPDGAIVVDSTGQPRIDYEHCKGCMICVAQCPPHAIEAVPERGAETTSSPGAV